MEYQIHNPAFVSSTALLTRTKSVRQTICRTSFVHHRTIAVPVLKRHSVLRMNTEDPESNETNTTGTTSASDILKEMRDDAANDPVKDEPKSRSMLGVYRDVDGKSNVWAVEPVEQTDTNPQISKTVIIAVAAGFIVAALLILPLLPFTNPDQM